MENQIQPNNTPIQPAPQVSITPTTNWQKTVLFILLGLVVIAGSVFIGVQVGKNQAPYQKPIVTQPTITPTQTIVNPTASPTEPSPTTNLTADWKTYTDNRFPFLFKYPTNSKVELLTGFSEANNILLEVSPNNKNQFLIQVQNNPAGGQYLIVVNSPDKREIATKQWVVSYITERTVDFGYPLQGNGPFLVYQFVNQNVSYAIIFNGSATDNIQDQILSSFKFTN